MATKVYSPPEKGLNEIEMADLLQQFRGLPQWLAEQLAALGLKLSGHRVPVDPMTNTTFDGVLPQDLHLRPASELTRLLNWFGSLANYISEWEIIYRQAVGKEDYIIGKMKKHLLKYSIGANAEIREANVELDRDLITMEERHFAYSAIWEHLKAAMDRAIRSYNVCWRIIQGRDEEQQRLNQTQAVMAAPNMMPQPAPWRRDNTGGPSDGQSIPNTTLPAPLSPTPFG